MPEVSLNNKKLVRNTLFLYLRMVFVMCIALFTTRVVLQVLGVVDYGVYSVVAGFVTLFAVLNNCLSTGTNRFYNYALGKGDDVEFRKVYNASVRIQLIMIVLLVLLLETIGTWYINNKMVLPADRLDAANIVFQCSLISLISVLLQIPYSAAVLANERIDFFAFVSIVDAFCKLGIALLISNVGGDKLIVYGLLLASISIVDLILYYFYCKCNFKALKLSKSLDRGIFKLLLVFSGWSTLDPLSYIVRDQGSNMTLNLFFGPVVNAAYGISAQLSSAVTSFASNLSVAFRPQIIQSYSSGNYDRTKSLMLSMSKISFTLQVIIAIPLIFELNTVLHLWLGDTIPEYTIIFAALVLIINCINTLNEPVSIIMVSTGKIKLVKSVSLFIITSVVPIGYLLLYLGLPPYYIYVTMFCLTIINQVSCVFIMSKKFPVISVKIYISNVAIPCAGLFLSSLVVPFIISSFFDASILRVVILSVLSGISSFTLAYFIFFNRQEKDIVLSLLKMFRR